MNVSKSYGYVGNTVAIKLATMLFLTSCDRVIYFYRQSKKAIPERALKQEVLAIEVLSDLGKYAHLSETPEEKLK